MTMQVYAHRGLHREVPENTMDAFLRAELGGLDGIETDLRTTADQEVVLFHDRQVGGVPVANMTHAELVRKSGIDVPRLQDVLERRWRLMWNFEFKTTAAVELAIPLLRGRLPEGTILSSFIHPAVETAVTEIGGEGALLLASRPLHDTLLPRATSRIRTLVWDWNVVHPAAFEDASSLGWRNMVYGVQTPGEHEVLEVLRPWGVITDHPEMVPGDLRNEKDGR